MDVTADHVLVKRGLYYRPNAQGYTGLKCEAGLYPRSYALGLDGVVAVPVADAPEFSPACWEQTKVSHLQATLAAREAELAGMREENARLRAQIWQAVEDEAKLIWASEPISGSRAYYGCEWEELTDRKRDSIRLQALSSFGLARAALGESKP